MLVWLLIALASEPDEIDRLEDKMTELVNVERVARGLVPLESRPELTAIAREYSRRMASAGEVNHGLDRPMDERIRKAIPRTCHFGENVSKHTSIDYSIGDLMLSDGHRQNILHDKFTLIGVGIVRGDDGFLYITQEFARPCEARPVRPQRPHREGKSIRPQ